MTSTEKAYYNISMKTYHKLSEIRDAMLTHKGNADDKGLDWSHVGDLGHVNELLDEILVFLRGEED